MFSSQLFSVFWCGSETVILGGRKKKSHFLSGSKVGLLWCSAAGTSECRCTRSQFDGKKKPSDCVCVCVWSVASYNSSVCLSLQCLCVYVRTPWSCCRPGSVHWTLPLWIRWKHDCRYTTSSAFYIYATHEAANWDACLICSFTDFGKKSPPLFRVSSGRWTRSQNTRRRLRTLIRKTRFVSFLFST